MCSSSEMTFSNPPRLSHMPYTTFEYNYHQEQRSNNHQHNDGIIESNNMMSKQFNIYDSLFLPTTPAADQQNKEFYASSSTNVVEYMDSNTTPAAAASTTTTTTAATSADADTTIQSSNQQQNLQHYHQHHHQQQHLSQNTELPPMLPTYFENSYTRTFTGIYIPGQNNSYKLSEETLQRNMTDSSNTYTNLTDGTSYNKSYSRLLSTPEQDQLVSPGLGSPSYFSSQNPYCIYRSTSFTSNSNVYNNSTKFGGK